MLIHIERCPSVLEGVSGFHDIVCFWWDGRGSNPQSSFEQQIYSLRRYQLRVTGPIEQKATIERVFSLLLLYQLSYFCNVILCAEDRIRTYDAQFFLEVSLYTSTFVLVEMIGVEPMASCLQSRRSKPSELHPQLSGERDLNHPPTDNEVRRSLYSFHCYHVHPLEHHKCDQHRSSFTRIHGQLPCVPSIAQNSTVHHHLSYLPKVEHMGIEPTSRILQGSVACLGTWHPK